MKKQELKKNKNGLSSLKGGARAFRDPLSPSHLQHEILVRGENKRDFFDLVHQICLETPTYTRIEKEFLKKYIFCVWKLRRMRQIEKYLLDKQNSFVDDGIREIELPGKVRIRNITRIEINEEITHIIFQQDKLEKAMIKALKYLREEQRLRNPQKDEE